MFKQQLYKSADRLLYNNDSRIEDIPLLMVQLLQNMQGTYLFPLEVITLLCCNTVKIFVCILICNKTAKTWAVFIYSCGNYYWSSVEMCQMNSLCKKWPNTELFLFSWIKSKYRKIRTRNNSVSGHLSRSGLDLQCNYHSLIHAYRVYWKVEISYIHFLFKNFCCLENALIMNKL